MANYLNPWSARQFVDANGNPYSGAKLFTYVAGSSTKVTTYKDEGGASSHANPIILNTKGEPADTGGSAQPIWQAGGAAVKLVLAPAGDTDPPTSPIDYWDNISGINDTTVTIDQWIAGPTPTYVGATSFTLVGDQTSTFHIGRRIKTTKRGGTIYSTITNSAYTSLTTVTVVNDSGSLDSGLSAVSYGVISATNTSIPGVEISGDDWTHQGIVTNESQVRWSKGADFASANALTLGTDGNYFDITGTTAITSIGTLGVGTIIKLHFDGALTLTHHATDLILPGAANITTAAGDEAEFIEYATGDWRCTSYVKASGFPVVTSSDVQTFTSSGTWTKPSGYGPNSQVRLQAWGGGASGGCGALATSVGGGGGGGAYKEEWRKLSEFGATETITVGLGGTAVSGANQDGIAGGDTTIGALMTAYGGGRGGAGTTGAGGGGGGLTAAGGNATAGSPGTGGDDGVGKLSHLCGGAGGNDGNPPTAGASGILWGGGGGGGADTAGENTVGVGGSSIWGGGGGGGAGEATAGAPGGSSLYGGAGGAGSTGGANGTAGTAPGGGGGGCEGGGGASGPGADGKAIITVFA